MKLEGGRISQGQVIFLVMSFSVGATILRTPASGARHADWLAIILGLIGGILVAYMFTTLNVKFPGKTLVEFNDLIYGPFLGKLISLAYIFYFFVLATLTLRLFGDFLKGLIFTETPVIVLISLMTLICASAVRNGIEVIARCNQILLPFTIILISLSIILGIPQMELNRFLPIFDIPVIEFLKISFYTATFPFGESIAFLMILAFVNKDLQEVKRARISLIFGLIGGAIILILVAVRNTGMLGVTKAISNYASYQAVRLISLGENFTRVEIIVSLNFLAMGFMIVAILYYTTTLGLAQVLKLRTYLPLVLPIGILLTCTTIIQFENIFEYKHFSESIITYFSFPFQILIPILSLIICKIRGLPKEGD
ncbi:MAG: GerAB/ArcD/ProY family transporter [Peptococcales bacterium]|jgi:spore germination protein KB